MQQLITLICCIVGIIANSYATITVEVSTDNVAIGAPFRLIVTEDHASQNLPDLTPLKQHFTILGTEHNLSYTLINGNTSTINQWIILLTANHTGKVVIPSLHIGQALSPPVSINVQAGAKSQIAHKDVFFTTTSNIKDPYVNQQLLYTVKLYAKEQLFNVSYQPPQMDNALIIPLGDSKRTEEILQDQAYAVEEQKYAIFAQHSGTLRGPSLQAIVYGLSPTPLHLPPTIEAIHVKSRPTQDSWLPVKDLKLTENYQGLHDKIKVGGSITRVITMVADELPAQFLPTFSFNNAAGYHVYTDKPELSNKVNYNSLQGTLKLTVTYLFNQPGKITLPDIKVTWFNTQTEKFAIASLPAQNIVVAGNAIPKTPKIPIITQNNSNYSQLKIYLYSGLYALFCIIILILLYYLIKLYRKRGATLRTFKRACLSNNAKLAYDTLLAYAKQKWPHEEWHDLLPLQKLVGNAQLNILLDDLSAALYDKAGMKWSGLALWQCIRNLGRGS